MNTMTGIHRPLAELIDRLTTPGLEFVARQSVLATADQFAAIPGVEDYRARLVTQAPLSSPVAAAFATLHEEYERLEFENEERNGPEVERDRLFAWGRYAYALATTARDGPPMDARRLSSILYDMGHAMPAPDGFWEIAFGFARAAEQEYGSIAPAAGETTSPHITRMPHPIRQWWWRQRASRIRAGMTRAEVEMRLGPPDQTDMTPDGDVLCNYSTRRYHLYRMSICVSYTDSRVVVSSVTTAPADA